MSRPSRILATLFLGCATLAPGLVAAADGHAASEAGRPFRPGERLEYTVSLGVLSSAATIRLDTLPPVPADDGTRLRLLSEVRPGPVMEAIYPFFYRLISTVSVPRMLPQQGSRQMQERDEREFVALTFDHASGRVRQADRAGGDPVRVDPIEPDTRDLLSALYHLRSVDQAVGRTFSVFENDKLYRVTMRAEERSSIEVPAGRFAARRYRIDTRGPGEDEPVRELDLWLSDDGRVLPLRLQASTAIGPLLAELTLFEEASAAPGR